MGEPRKGGELAAIVGQLPEQYKEGHREKEGCILKQTQSLGATGHMELSGCCACSSSEG